MQRVSMPSDLAATSPLLLQLLIPQGFTLQSRPAQTQSQTQAPWLQRDLLLTCFSPRSRPLDQPCSHTPVPGPRNNTPTFDFFFLADYNKQQCKKPNSGTAEPALCPGSCHSMRDAACWGLYTYEVESTLRDISISHRLSLCSLFPLLFVFVTLSCRCLMNNWYFFFAWNALIQRRKQAFNVLYIGDATNRDLNYLTMSLRDSKSNMCTKAHPHERMPVQLVTKFSWGIDSSTCKSISTSPHQYACLVFLTSSRTTVSVDDWGSFSDLRPDHNAIGHCKPLTIA